MKVDHKIVEAMAASWDAAGHRSPKDWHYVCSCGHRESTLKDQMAMYAAWEAHRDEATSSDA
jgi:hypothetical protein